MVLLVIFVFSVFAFTLSALCGGGAGLLLIPFLERALPLGQVPAALSIGTFTSSASRLFVFWKQVRWDIVRWFVPSALPAVWLGAWLLKFLDPHYLGLCMGLFLMANLPYLFRLQNKKEERPLNSRGLLAGIGFTAGFLSGLTGAVGLLFNRIYFRYGLSKEEVIATRAANEIVLHLIKIVLYSLFGLLSLQVLSVGLVVALAALLSTWMTKTLLVRLSENLFKRIGYAAMVISGLVMFGQSGKDILVANRGQISANLLSDGLETRLKWRDANLSLEFSYDEGFEFEQVIRLSELTPEHIELVKSKNAGCDQIVVEAVHSLEGTTYEAYYYKNGELIDKFDFE